MTKHYTHSGFVISSGVVGRSTHAPALIGFNKECSGCGFNKGGALVRVWVGQGPTCVFLLPFWLKDRTPGFWWELEGQSVKAPWLKRDNT